LSPMWKTWPLLMEEIPTLKGIEDTISLDHLGAQGNSYR
jgi:hypothetical protein